MPFGEIFTGTFSQIWRHNRLWLFGLLGLALTSIGLGIYQLFQFRWQNQLADMMGGVSGTPGVMPPRFFSELMPALTWLGVGFGIWMLVSLLGYITNLVMRGATMNEAAVAWAGERVETGRGISAGAGRAVYVFLLDLLWLLPAILLGCGSLGALVATLAAVGNANHDGSAAGAFMLTLLGALCCVFCLALFVSLLSAVFAPLMYQSAVAGRRGLGAAISEGWRLAQANLGAMIIFAVLLWVLAIVVMMAVSVLSLPFAIPWLSGYMRAVSGMMEDAARGIAPTMPSFRSGWLLLATLVSGLLSWLATGFLQSFRLTLYAGVYRQLGGESVPIDPGPPAPVDESPPAPHLRVGEPAETTADARSSPDLPEIAVPDETPGPAETPVNASAG